jgi:hypothetical protein
MLLDPHRPSNILPTLVGVDQTLHPIASNSKASENLISDIAQARQQIGLISAQLGEYFGGFDLAEITPAPLSQNPISAEILIAKDNITNQKVTPGILKKLFYPPP